MSIHDAVDGELIRSGTGLGRAAVSWEAIDSMLLLIIVSTPNVSGGPYVLSVTCTAPTPPSSCTWSGMLVCGQTANGILAAGECDDTYYADYYKVALQRGQILEATVTAGFGVYVEIYDDTTSAGTWAQGDAQETVSFVAATDAVHRVRVSSRNPRVIGSYSLAIRCNTASPCRTRSVRH